MISVELPSLFSRCVALECFDYQLTTLVIGNPDTEVLSRISQLCQSLSISIKIIKFRLVKSRLERIFNNHFIEDWRVLDNILSNFKLKKFQHLEISWYGNDYKAPIQVQKIECILPIFLLKCYQQE